MTIDVTGGTIQIDPIDADLVTETRWYISQSGHTMRVERLRDGKRRARYLAREICARSIGRALPPGYHARSVSGDRSDLRRDNIGIAYGPGGTAKVMTVEEFRSRPIRWRRKPRLRGGGSDE